MNLQTKCPEYFILEPFAKLGKCNVGIQKSFDFSRRGVI